MAERQKTQGNQSGEKMMAIFEYLVIRGDSVRLLDIAADLGMNASTVLRFLNTLITTGYVEQEQDSQRYRPTYKVVALANHINLNADLRRIVRPYMEQLSRLFGESVNMAVENHGKSVYIEVIRDPRQSLMMFQSVGNEAPMYCTGNGKVLLLNYSEEELEAYVAGERMEKYTENTIVTLESLKNELEQIRRRGFSYDEGEREAGARCVAFPIYDAKGRVAAGMSVTGPRDRMTDEHINERLPEFRRMAEEISGKLGYRQFENVKFA